MCLAITFDIQSLCIPLTPPNIFVCSLWYTKRWLFPYTLGSGSHLCWRRSAFLWYSNGIFTYYWNGVLKQTYITEMKSVWLLSVRLAIGRNFPWIGYEPKAVLSPVVGLLPLASGPACLGMSFPPFLVKQLYRFDSVVISSFVRTGYTTRRWGWLLGSIGYSITHHYT